MSAVQYPFIDIAVHIRVRERFAMGDAIVLFSPDMTAPLWANGRGAALFGFSSIYDFLDHGPNRVDIAFRQIEAVARQLEQAGDTRSVTIRVASGFQRVAMHAACELIDVQGEPAVLFSVPVEKGPLSPVACATRMIEGFDDPDTHMAVVDDQGAVLVSSADFESLGITDQTAKMLATMVSSDQDRLVKQPIPTTKGYLPAAMGRISDEPALNLLFTVEAVQGRPAAAEFDSEDEVEIEAHPVLQNEPEVELIDEPADDVLDSDAYQDVIAAVADIEEPEETEEEISLETAESFSEEADISEPETLSEAIAELRPEHTVEAEADQPAAIDAPGFAFQRDGRATRFVWKIDSEGRFSEVSGEFADAVGPHAADINGMAFSDLSALFNLDPEGKITELLNKRDTWSGKTIWWPVEGTALVVPVDLAALPTYTRNRDFDGFRGFGIVRIADAADDPNGLGLTLAQRSIEDTAQPETEKAKPAEALPQEEMVVRPHMSGQQVPSMLDWPNGEPPALKIVETPARRHSDKVIQFEELRSNRGQGLSPNEQTAFREIARRLDDMVGHPEENEALEDANAVVAEQPQPVLNEPIETAPEEFESEEAFEAEAEAFAENANEAFEEPSQAEAAEFVAEEESEQPALSDRELLSQMIPMRERPGLSAEIVDQMPVALLVHNGDELIYGNPEFLRLTGYASLTELGDVGGLDALLQRQELEPETGEAGGMVVVRADDALVPVTARLQSVRWEETTALMLALMPVASETPQAAEPTEAEIIPLHPARSADQLSKLQVEAEELRAILETATDGVVIISSDGDIRSLNRSASALFNYDNEEVSGKPFVTLFAHESQRAILDYLSGLSGHGVASVLNDGREVIGREASGGFLPLFMTIGRLTSSNGYCAVIRDITQWKRTEDELRNAKRAAETANNHKSDFLAHVSHEIRTPLNAIIGFADMMATERFGPIGHPRYVEYANDIGRSGRHVLDIVNDLLDISKIEAGQMDLDFRAVGLNETISEAVSLVQPQANSQRVIIRTALSHSVPQVVADIRSIKQIALNILSNAIRFTPSGGQIVVSTAYEPNGSVVLRVRDTGIGMTRSELELAMKPFRQVPGAGRKRGDGTGLGLPLTKAMVDANRASFAITSAPNEGTLVEVTFPSQRVLAT